MSAPKKKILTPQVIRQLDYWAGVPLCLLLTLWRRICQRLLPPRAVTLPPRKILFIKMTEQGATIIAESGIRRAIEMVGRDNVYFWVFNENREILELLDLIPAQNILGIRADHPLDFLLDVARSLFKIRRLRIDTTIDLEFFSRAPAILATLTGASRRVGLDRFSSEAPYRGDLLTHRVQYNAYVHTSEMIRLLVESLAADAAEVPLVKTPARGLLATVDPGVRSAGRNGHLPEPPRFVPTEAEQQAVWSILQAQTPQTVRHPVILLNPNASDLLPLRKWPTERFEEVARRLLSELPEATIVFTGGPSEAARPEEMVRAIGSPRLVSMAGKTTLRQLITLYTLADVLVTNDSGPGHFSSMTDIQAIIMFGPETPLLYGPMGRASRVLWSGLACSPCVNVYNHRFSPCTDNKCMQAIDVQQVVEAVREVVGRDRGSIRV